MISIRGDDQKRRRKEGRLIKDEIEEGRKKRTRHTLTWIGRIKGVSDFIEISFFFLYWSAFGQVLTNNPV